MIHQSKTSDVNLCAHLSSVFFSCIVFSALLAGSLSAQTEIGEDDLRLSHAGPDGNTLYDAAHEGVAYDSGRDRYLIVWDADARVPGTDLQPEGKREIYGRLVDGAGLPLGPESLLVTLGPSSDAAWDAKNPEVVFNASRQEYLVVFVGTTAAGANAAKREIFVQRLDPLSAPIGAPKRVTETGAITNLDLDSREPAIAHNDQEDEYLVVWQREERDSGSGAENEIYAQRLSGQADLIGGALPVSSMGPRGDAAYDGADPAVAFNSNRNEYLVVWRGDDNRSDLVNGEFEIFGQRLTASASPIGIDDFRISRMGPNRSATFDAEDPFAVHNPDRDEYLVTWTATDNPVDGDEVYAELLAGDGATLREQFRVSAMGPAGDLSFAVDETEAVYNPSEGEYFVVWMGTQSSAPGIGRDGREVYGQRLASATGDPIGVDDVPVSSMGPAGTSRFDAYSLDVGYNTLRNEYFVAWSGDDNRSPLVDDELEIFSQRLEPTIPPCLPDGVSLCLAENRFRVRVSWATPDGKTGIGTPFTLTGDTGGFWFFREDNVELVTKVLDGRPVNGKFWIFVGALSAVEYELTVFDTVTGEAKSIHNEQGSLASIADTDAFPLAGNSDDSSFELTAMSRRGQADTLLERATTGSCAASGTTLCLSDDRFQIEVSWYDAKGPGSTGSGRATELTADTGTFWFFAPANIELIIKVLDGRPINGHFWVFFGALSNVEYEVTVTDTQSGTIRRYRNPAGTLASVADTRAFP